MKKIRIFLLLITFSAAFFCVAFAVDTPCVSIEQTEASAGSVVELLMSVENNPGIAAATIDFNYDTDKLSLISYSVDDAFDEEFMLVSVDEQTGRLSAATMRNKDYNGAVLRMQFEVLPGSEGTASVNIVSTSCYDYDENSILFDTVSGGVTINGESAEATGNTAESETTATEENTPITTEQSQKEQETQELLNKSEAFREYGIEIPQQDEVENEERDEERDEEPAESAAIGETELVTETAYENETDEQTVSENTDAEQAAAETTIVMDRGEEEKNSTWIIVAGASVVMLLLLVFVLPKCKPGYAGKH